MTRAFLLLASLLLACSDDATAPVDPGQGGAGSGGSLQGGQGGKAAGGAGGSGGATAGGAGGAGSGGAGGAGSGAAGVPAAGAGGAAGSTAGAAGALPAGGAGSGPAGQGGQAAGGDAGSSGASAGSGGSDGGQGGAGAGSVGGGAGAGGAGEGGASGGSGGAGQAGAGGAGQAGAGGAGAGGASGGGLGELLTQGMFDQMFLHRDDPACSGAIFTYAAFVEAAKAFPAFASEGDADARRREVAAFLANAGHETTGGWPAAPDGPQAWGLCFREEVGCGGGGCTAYCVDNATYPCAPGKTYHGRGPLQISYNYNYGQAGDALSLPLLATPELVASDGVVAFKAALWFWMTTQLPKPSCHDVMVGKWQPSAADLSAGRKPGFGMTINIINGGLECGFATPPQVQDRLDFYAKFTQILGVSGGDNLDCASMQHY